VDEVWAWLTIGYDSVCRRIASNGPRNATWYDDAT
jgi:hypothetical protein